MKTTRKAIRTARALTIGVFCGGLGMACLGIVAGAARVAPEPQKPVAIVGQRQIFASDLHESLLEAVGGQVLEELALGAMVRDACDKKGIAIGPDQVKAERTLLAEQLTAASGTSATDAELLIAQVRRTRGLGDARFTALLQRNAGLRALVRKRDGVIPVSDDDLLTAYGLKYGPRVQGRIIVTSTREAAERAAARVRDGEPFARVAVEMSTDASASQGGLLRPMHTADVNVPVIVRRTLGGLKAGQVSDIVSLPNENGVTAFAVLALESEVPANPMAPTMDAARSQLEQEIRVVRERAKMESLGRELSRGAGVIVMDRSLDWSWRVWNGETP